MPPKLFEKLYPDDPARFPKHKPFNDIDLDHHQMLLLRHLSEFCDNRYSTPGGNESTLYADLIHKLSLGSKHIAKSFMLTFGVTFHCRYCCGPGYPVVTSVPVVRFPGKKFYHSLFESDSDSSPDVPIVKLSDHVLDIKTWGDCVNLTCSSVRNGSICGGNFRLLTDLSFISLPELLVFHLDGFVSRRKRWQILVEKTISLVVNGNTIDYNLLAFSSVYQIWNTEHGCSRGIRYTLPLPGDRAECWHTVVNLVTDSCIIEVNNGKLYSADDYLSKFHTNNCLVFYQKSCYNWLPHFEV